MRSIKLTGSWLDTRARRGRGGYNDRPVPIGFLSFYDKLKAKVEFLPIACILAGDLICDGSAVADQCSPIVVRLGYARAHVRYASCDANSGRVKVIYLVSILIVERRCDDLLLPPSVGFSSRLVC